MRDYDMSAACVPTGKERAARDESFASVYRCARRKAADANGASARGQVNETQTNQTPDQWHKGGEPSRQPLATLNGSMGTDLRDRIGEINFMRQGL